MCMVDVEAIVRENIDKTVHMSLATAADGAPGCAKYALHMMTI